ncbi:MAG: class I SAM-dependent methyltransferase [Williamsia sp.]|nr:class I SAM-dependent methyltransferase [Williamsia sp.]
MDIDIAKSLLSIAHSYKDTSHTKNVFVAGCGDGTEASAIRTLLKANVVGVDSGLLNEYEDKTLKILNRDLMNLDFPNSSFDLVYSYHVLEHVPDPSVVLKKLSDMLTPEGLLVVGFPNRSRLLGYVGSQNITLKNLIKWNLTDYGYRVRGKFKNEHGAHAGFTKREFIKLAKPYFKKVDYVSNHYFLNKYKNKQGLVKFLIKTGLSSFFYPSIYFICSK